MGVWSTVVGVARFAGDFEGSADGTGCRTVRFESKKGVHRVNDSAFSRWA